mgnify:CR=1 FL=1
MPTIRDIDINDLSIKRIDIPPVIPADPTVLSSPLYVPVTVDIGLPIVNVPGCVEAHETKNPKNSVVTSDDPKGTITYCDAGVPGFSPIPFEPDVHLRTPAPKIDTRKKTERPQEQIDAPTPKTPPIPPTPEIQCPTAKQLANEPIGFIFDGGRKQVTGYKLEGTECKRIVEDVPIPAQIVNAIPPAGVITTTATIAVVATTSALVAKPFADILLKVVKPTIKKVMKKIATIRKKPVKTLSQRERILEQRQRNLAIRTLRETLKPKK